jgi:CBS domain-containing protein
MSTISDVMTASPQCAQAQDSVQHVAQQMEQGNFGSMPVMDGGRFAGVVTDRDIAIRGVAKGSSPDQPVAEVMSADPVCVAPDCDLQEAAQLMQDKQIRRLYVTDRDQLVGVAALADVVGSAGDRLSGETIEKISEG